MAHTLCNVTAITALTSAVYEVVLSPSTAIQHQAGQYLKVIMGDDDARPFSIANPMHESNELTLQIGAHPDNPYAWQVLEKLRQSESIVIDAPHGNAFFRDNQRPLLLLSGGTGFSYTYAILQQALKTDPERNIQLFWGVRQQQDFYCLEHLNQLLKQHTNFNFHPVVEHPEPEWKGLSGWVHKAVISETNNLDNYDVYVAGRFEMAKVVRDDFFALGLSQQQLIGDAFEYL